MKMKKLPKKIYATWESSTGLIEDSFLRTEPDPMVLAETDTTRNIGVYELVGYVKLVNVTAMKVKSIKNNKLP